MSTFSNMVAGSLVVAALGASSTAGAGAPVVTQFNNKEMEAVFGVSDECGFTEIIIAGFDSSLHQNGGPPLVVEDVAINFFSFNSCDGTFITGAGTLGLPSASVQVAANGSQGSLSASFTIDLFHSGTGTTTTVPVSVTLAMTANGSPTITKTHQRQPGIQAHSTTFQVSAIPTGSVTIDSQTFSLAGANAFFFLTTSGSVFQP